MAYIKILLTDLFQKEENKSMSKAAAMLTLRASVLLYFVPILLLNLLLSYFFMDLSNIVGRANFYLMFVPSMVLIITVGFSIYYAEILSKMKTGRTFNLLKFSLIISVLYSIFIMFCMLVAMYLKYNSLTDMSYSELYSQINILVLPLLWLLYFAFFIMNK
ncbi:TPA: hypothetical protein NV714_001673 [Escherichia coli]|nr:hypothetical protein [Escherichia coli]